jgi:hypothetical protein
VAGIALAMTTVTYVALWKSSVGLLAR